MEIYLKLVQCDYMSTCEYPNCKHMCDVACHNQAFVAEISCSVIILLRKSVTLAFI